MVVNPSCWGFQTPLQTVGGGQGSRKPRKTNVLWGFCRGATAPDFGPFLTTRQSSGCAATKVVLTKGPKSGPDLRNGRSTGHACWPRQNPHHVRKQQYRSRNGLRSRRIERVKKEQVSGSPEGRESTENSSPVRRRLCCKPPLANPITLLKFARGYHLFARVIDRETGGRNRRTSSRS